MTEHPLIAAVRPARDEMLATLGLLVKAESPSNNKAALDHVATLLETRFRAFGDRVERIANIAGGDHLRVRFNFDGATDEALAPGLVLCHFDTVWPVGTLEGMPFRVENGRAFGPGVFDMKASLVLVEHAIRAIRSIGQTPKRPIVALFTSDEETGSHTSRDLIEAEATRSAYALVMEAPLSGGRLKTARKGVGGYHLRIEGKAAHAGVEPEKGVSAVVELAHQILAVQSLARPELGTTVNVGVVEGGSASNVVPARAIAHVDVRVSRLDEADRIQTAMHSLRPYQPGAEIRVVGRFNRPPMERSPQGVALFERARAIGRALGMDLGEGPTGGASDGNFTAALGVPTLDGLGVEGEGAHAHHEQIIISSLTDRAALLAALLLDL